jgi:Bax protein
MEVKGVIESIINRIGGFISSIITFVTSDDFISFIRRIVAWIEAAIQWAVKVILELADKIAVFVQSDNFKDGIRRCRKHVTRAGRIARSVLEPIVRWVSRGFKAITTSEFVKTGVATLSDLFELFLPKPGQRVVAGASIIIVAMILVLSVPETEQEVTAPESKETVPGITRIESGMPNFKEFPAGRERKAAFFGYFLPIVENQNRIIQKTRLKLDDWYQSQDEISSRDVSEIDHIATRYRITDFDIESEENWDELFNRVDIVPPSLALAQSANESAWGTSRFARQAYNFFGQWCFKAGCGLVPAKRDAGKTHEVASFDSPQESVKMYIRNLNSNRAYKSLRDIRAELRMSNKAVTGHELAAGLMRYSERGSEYVSELREMIEYNKLAAYDTF